MTGFGVDFSSVPGGKPDANISTNMSLKVAGIDYKNWKSISVSKSLSQISGSFNFTASNLFPGDNSKWEIFEGSECTVELAGEKIITGYIDTIEPSYSSNDYLISFGGRDKTADLVDCSYDFVEYKNEMKGLSVIQIVEKLCDPFGINVQVDDIDVEIDLDDRRPVFRIDSGAKVYEIIAELLQQYGILPITTGDGDLSLVRTGNVKVLDILEGGGDILSASLSKTGRGRYSKYYVYGPQVNTTHNPKAVIGSFEDDYVKRFRPLMINGGKEATTDAICKNRAAWEARIREGASQQLELVLQSWLQRDTQLPWQFNSLVRVNDKYIGINEELLIMDIDYTLDDSSGELTRLVLVHPDTFKLEPSEPISDKKPKSDLDKNRNISLRSIGSIGKTIEAT